MKSKQQVTEFNLSGLGNLVVEGAELSEVGDEYPGKSGQTVISVEKVSSTAELFVNGVLLQQ
ncbi:hypothetical protein [Bacillus sp. FJAT-18017]|uniref:hypothetical protein n=1 Tax=Bacillus sp. FJAT-18017 TaxID=1705566 RepID=UPI0012E20EDB|nr:hypothetical protein [Bacillus sp. FJAT-18017]